VVIHCNRESSGDAVCCGIEYATGIEKSYRGTVIITCISMSLEV